MPPRKFPKNLVVRTTQADDDSLHELASRFDLPLSQVARRALRVGIKFLDEIDFPGSTVEVKKPD
jgi:hypothetical protein